MFVDYTQVDNNEIRKMIKELNKCGALPDRIVLTPNMRKSQYVMAFIQHGIEVCHDAGTLDDVPDHVYDYYLRIAKPDNRPPKSKAQKPKKSTKAPRSEFKAEKKNNGQNHSEKIQAPKSADKDASAIKKSKRGRKPKKLPAVKKVQQTELVEANKEDNQELSAKNGANKKPLKRTRTVTKKSAVRRKQTEERRAERKRALQAKKSREISRSVDSAACKKTRAVVYADIVRRAGPLTRQGLIREMNRRYGGSEAEAAYWVGGYCSLLIALGKMRKYKDGTFLYEG